MAKRFGRNQKRKLKLENHTLSVQLDVLRERVKSQKQTTKTYTRNIKGSK